MNETNFHITGGLVELQNPTDKEIVGVFSSVDYPVPPHGSAVVPAHIGRHILRQKRNTGLTGVEFDTVQQARAPLGLEAEVQKCPYCTFETRDFGEFAKHIEAEAQAQAELALKVRPPVSEPVDLDALQAAADSARDANWKSLTGGGQ